MLLLHISDLHLSRYGESGTWRTRDGDDNGEWETLHAWQRWHIEGVRDRKGRPDDMRLVDPEGVVHKVRNWPSRKEEKVVSALLTIAMKRHETSAERLIKNRPTQEDLDALLQVDLYNTNLRFLKMVDGLTEASPDIVLLTGDVTDNGFGYGLVRHYLEPWIRQQRLFVIPGNHDTYDMLPRRGRRARIEKKEERFAAFAANTGIQINKAGSYVARVDDIAVVGLNSCQMPRTPLSASGAVSREQLAWLEQLGQDAGFRGTRMRIGLVHHHLLRMPFSIGKRNPIEVGMRLRNATEVMQTCTDAGIDMLFNGHRHHGYAVKLPGRPTVISAPSATLGCKSVVNRVYGWRVNLSDRVPFPALHELFVPPASAEAHP
jgi:3',5'-cyclic AMP phosphodiesterase CpdA